MEFHLLNSLILTGILQGFIFGFIYLFSNRFNSSTAKYLALLLLVFSYNNLQFFVVDAGLISGANLYKTLYIPMGPLIPVFIWLFVLQYTHSSKIIPLKKWAYFVPFIVFTTNIMLYKIWSLVTPVSVTLYQKFKLINDIQSVFSALYTLVLISLSIVRIYRVEKIKPKDQKHSTKTFTWLKITLICLLCLSMLWSVALYKYLTDTAYKMYFQFLWLGLTVAIYWLGHSGVYKLGVWEQRNTLRKHLHKKTSTQLSLVKTNEHLQKFEHLLKVEKKYLNPKLSLEDVAYHLNLSKGHLSRIINAELQTSYSEYVNHLRIEESKKLLSNPEFSKYTLVSIGLESGFSSKSTFNQTFKKFTGLTPSQYKKSI